jgi:hypothetical protein
VNPQAVEQHRAAQEDEDPMMVALQQLMTAANPPVVEQHRVAQEDEDQMMVELPL